jgi:hypothetical protein
MMERTETKQIRRRGSIGHSTRQEDTGASEELRPHLVEEANREGVRLSKDKVEGTERPLERI